MNKRGIIITIIIAIVLLAGVAFFLTRDANAPASETTDNTTQPSTDTSNQQNGTNQQPTAGVTIVYTNTGFVKQTITVGAGDTVHVQNDSDNTLDFSSDDHPTHREQPILNLGDIAPGQSKTLVMNTTGTWGFHNHDNAAHTGTLVVE